MIDAKNNWKYVNGCKTLASAFSYAFINKKWPAVLRIHNKAIRVQSLKNIGSQKNGPIIDITAQPTMATQKKLVSEVSVSETFLVKIV